ncbi:MAG: ABC transporter ATP-binding protein [Acidimicrobiia bacterium]|nr:ABC transporter ATP-binding protein [Acidimicrobiia bacterium]
MTATNPTIDPGPDDRIAAIVRLRSATRTYGEGATLVRALDRVDLDIAAGQYVVLLGPSGSGKTTLLNIIGGIDTLTSGTVEVNGSVVEDLDRQQLTEFRRANVAFIFQLYNLVPTLTAVENVQLIAELTGGGRERSVAALAAVGLGDHIERFPSELSGGQQQRVAVARALAKDCPVLLCDEPTGALDQASGQQVLDLLGELNREHSRTVVLVTHDETIAERADRVIHMIDGRVDGDRAGAGAPIAENELSR